MKLVATGDSILTRRVGRAGDASFEALRSLVGDAVVAFTNLEVSTPHRPMVPSPNVEGRTLIHASPYALDDLASLGFNLFSLANNHATDYGAQGLLDTIDGLERRGMVYAGAGRDLAQARAPGYLDTDAARIALVAVSSTYSYLMLAEDPRGRISGRPGVSPLRYNMRYVLDPDRFQQLRGIAEAFRGKGFQISESKIVFVGTEFTIGEAPAPRMHPYERDLTEINRQVVEARRQADFVIVSVHWHEGRDGVWYAPEPNQFHIDAAHAWIDAGADIVVGHGAHRIRGIEMYRGKPILYSAGNFFFMLETVSEFPQELYEHRGLPRTAAHSELMDLMFKTRTGEPGSLARASFWESVIVRADFDAGRVTQLEVLPLDLGQDRPRSRRGFPLVAQGDVATHVLDELATLSRDLGTQLRISRQGDSCRATVDP